MRNHLIQVGFFGAMEAHKKRLMDCVCPDTIDHKYTIEKYDKIFNIHLKNIQNISCGCFDIHCMILVFDGHDHESFAHIQSNYHTIKQTVLLRNMASVCVFLLVCISDREGLSPFYDEVVDFVNTERLLHVTIKPNDHQDFKHMYDQILKMNLLENISLQPSCVVS